MKLTQSLIEGRLIKRDKRVILVPYFLQGVSGKAELMQQDGIHPRAEGRRPDTDVG